MNNYHTNGLSSKGSTPIKHLGLSRKRRSSCVQVNALISSKNRENCSEIEIKKQNIASTEISNKNLNVKENFENKPETQSDLEPSILDSQTKYAKEIKELENVYSVWANGFKNALFYLINLFQKRPGESLNVKQLLIKLGLWEIISDHFKDDLELGCFLSDDEDTD